MHSRIVAVLAFAKHPTRHCALVTLAILLYAMCLATFAAFLYLLKLKPQTERERLLLWVLFLFLLIVFCFEAMRISRQCFNNGLFMIGCIFLMIPTIITVTTLITKDFLLKAFTIQLQAFRPFTIAP